MMDIRCIHRGATERDMQLSNGKQFSKRLISHVFSKVGSKYGAAIKRGNDCRMTDWDRQFLPEAALNSLK